MKCAEVLVHKQTDDEVEKLCCRHDINKLEAVTENIVEALTPNLENLPEAANIQSKRPQSDLEFIAVKEEPINLHQKPWAGSAGVSSSFAVKIEADEVCAEARSGHAETENNLREGNSGAGNTSTVHQTSAGVPRVDVPDLENSPEAVNIKSKVFDGELEYIRVKEEPSNGCQELQASSSQVSCTLTLKKEVGPRSRNAETEDPLREGSSEACDTSTLHQKTNGASQGSADLLPVDASDGICCVEAKLTERQKHKFKCLGCGNRCSRRKLASHEIVNQGSEKQKPFKCEFCDYASSSSGSLKLHLASKHGIGKLLKCEFCDYCSAYGNSVQRHQASKHGFGKLLKCRFCDYNTHHRSSFKRHLGSKHGIGKSIKCELCDYASSCNDSLKRHLASKHGIGKLLTCKFCDYFSAHSSVIKRHEASKHGVGKLLKCEICDYSSAYRSHFKQHLASKHSIGELLKCEFCDYTSRNNLDVKRHKARKHGSSVQV